jgi:Mn2+/Fe2+ NRAMP family transporter
MWIRMLDALVCAAVAALLVAFVVVLWIGPPPPVRPAEDVPLPPRAVALK